MRMIKQTKHNYHSTDVYRLWGDIVKRCTNEKSHNYKYYGGSGISICKEWRNNPKSFCDWALKNGYTKGLEIDRINNDGNYEPNNCHFITHKENCKTGKRRIFSTNKTGLTGVSMSKNGKYEIYHNVNGKRKYMGVKDSLSEAINYKTKLNRSCV